MDDQQLVILLGTSVFLDSLGVTLHDELELSVMQMDSNGPGLSDRLRALAPDLVIFDLDFPCTSAILALLRERPDTTSLGVDHSFSQVTVLQSSLCPIDSMQQFCQLAQGVLGCNLRRQEGGAIVTGMRKDSSARA